MQWKVFFASAPGKYHLANNAPCQDSGHFVASNDMLVAAICDGAGSASEGHLGSDFFARKVPELVAESIGMGRFAKRAPSEYRDDLLAIIEEARSQARQIALSRQLDLREFACTIVGCITLEESGCFFHIGDGFAIFVNNTGEGVLSHPENGEYTDETYFVTDDDWKDHLRVTPISNIKGGCLIGLMSDGASRFAINRPKTGFYRPFIDPIVNFLNKATEHNGNQALKNVLQDEKTLEITPDDKALLLALAS